MAPFVKSKKTNVKILVCTTETFRILYKKLLTVAAQLIALGRE